MKDQTSWYSVRPNVLEELNNSIPRGIADQIKTKGVATKSDFIDCRHTGMLLCFQWNVFKYVVVFSLDCIYYSYTNVVWL